MVSNKNFISRKHTYLYYLYLQTNINIIIMEKSKEKSMILVYAKYSMLHHPLYIDSLFIPTQQLHVKLILSSLSKRQIEESVIISYPNQQISLFEIENSLKLKIPQAHLFQNELSEQPEKKDDKVFKHLQKASVKELKMKMGHKKQSTLQLIYKEQPFVQNKKNKNSIKLSQNRQKYEICLIYLSKKSDVFSVRFQWSAKIDVKKQLLNHINTWYKSQLRDQDVQYHRLEIELIPRKQIISFRFLKKQISSDKQLRSLVFSHQADAIYLGFDININDFKYIKPVRFLTEQNTINLKEVNNNNRKSNPITAINLKIVEPSEKILVIQFEDKTSMRLDYNQLKEYKIKYLLGILRVPNYDRKGLLVFNKLYSPDQQVSDFQFEYSSIRNDINFVKAIITSQKKLFKGIIDQELKLKQNQLKQIVTDLIQTANNKRFCLSAYLNQATYAQDNNQKGQYVYQIICDHIQKYFIEIVPFQAKVWNRYIKTMVQEIKTLPICRSEVYRVVDYECSAQQEDVIQFKNFLVTSRSRTKVEQMKINEKSKKTLFKILPKTGRSASNISEFVLEEVIFLPYTSFRIIRKKIYQNLTEIKMEEDCREEQQYKSNLLIWVDNKKQQGTKLFKMLKDLKLKHPIRLLQLGSNIQFEEAFSKNNDLFSDRNVRKIIITNMTRPQNLPKEKVNQIAGVDTLKLVKQNLKDPKTEVIFYIGNKLAAQEKLSKNGFDPSQCILQVDSTNLIKTLVKMCNWQDHQNSYEQIFQQQKLELPLQSKVKVGAATTLAIKEVGIQQPLPKQNPWGDMFSKIK